MSNWNSVVDIISTGRISTTGRSAVYSEVLSVVYSN
jgi:hypothetical protein